MKNKRIKIIAALLAASIALSGCGEMLYELTPEEEAVIVSYASQTLAKYNTFQQDGEIFVMQEILDGTQEEAVADPETDMQESEQPETEEPASPDIQDTADAQETMAKQEETVSISEALELGAISATYKGSSLCTTYEKSDVFAVDAENGAQLLVLDIELANQSGQDLHVDILSAKPTFQAVVNESQTVAAQTTILPNDLSTYQGDIAAGEVSETALLFQIPGDIQEISSIQLKITINGNQHTINL